MMFVKMLYLDFKANAISIPPEEYDRKVGTQRNWRGFKTSGGVCGLMRWSAQNLTNSWHIFLYFSINEIYKILQVLHGCRQLVLWDVRLSPVTDVTLIFIKHFNFLIYYAIKIRSMISWRKVRMKSSQCDPYELGYTRATTKITKSNEKEILS